MRRSPSPGFPAAFAALTAVLLLAVPVAAQQSSDGTSIEAEAAGALAAFGLIAVPSEAASAISFESGVDQRKGARFRSSQIGGGFSPDDGPLYFEGYLGWNTYDPVFVFSGGQDTSSVRAEWRSVALTGGVGWNFELDHGVIFRPIFNVSLGNITSEERKSDGLAGEIGSFLGGGMTAGGVGGSLVLASNRVWRNGWETDATLRHSQLYLKPIAGDSDVVGSAKAFTTALWTRLRTPTEYTAFGYPVRSVSEFAIGSYSGDQDEVLDSAWLMQIGVGAELDLEESTLPWISSGRLMLRYTRGEHLDGVSFGFGVSF